MPLPAFPTPRNNHGFETLSVNSTGTTQYMLYVFGGRNNEEVLGTTYALNVSAKTWTQKASMNSPREDMTTCTTSTGKIYAAGGYTEVESPSDIMTNNQTTGDWERRPTRAFEVYDPAANTWTEKAILPDARIGGRIQAQFNGSGVEQIFFVGGRMENGEEPANVYVYDPTGNAWSIFS